MATNIDDVIAKIKKAVRLANKTTSEGERDTALRLARRLAENNGVAFDEVAEEASVDKAVKVDDEEFKTTPGSEFGHACFIIRTHFGVIIMRSVSRAVGLHKSRLSWIGSRLNIDIAKHVYHILIRESRRAFREASKATGSVGVKLSREAFMRGFFWALHNKLTKNPLRNDLDLSIKEAERKLLSYQQEGHSVKESRQRNAKLQDIAALCKGMDAGNAVNLARPCEGQATASPFMLAQDNTPRLAI